MSKRCFSKGVLPELSQASKAFENLRSLLRTPHDFLFMFLSISSTWNKFSQFFLTSQCACVTMVKFFALLQLHISVHSKFNIE